MDVKKIDKMAEKRDAKGLIKALDDKSRIVRVAIVKALGRLEDPRAVEPLVRALGDSEDYVRMTAAEALGQIGDPRTVEPLIKALSDESERVRSAAAMALGELRDQRAVEPLIEVLSDSNSGVYNAAAKALGKLKDSRAVEPLFKSLAYNHEKIKVAAGALAELKDPRAAGPLINALVNSDSDVRKAVATALAELGEPKWIGLIKGDKDDISRLVESKDPRIIEPLIKRLNYVGNEDLRYRAVVAFGDFREKRATEALIELLGFTEVSEAAMNALCKIDDPNIVESLVKVITSNNVSSKRPASVVLLRIAKAHPELGILDNAQYKNIMHFHVDVRNIENCSHDDFIFNAEE